MNGAELKKLREKTGLSQQRFAVLILDVTAETVNRWECDSRPIDPLKADGIKARVADYLRKKRRK